MPLTGATFRQRTQEEILSLLEAELRAEFGEDIDLTESSAFRTFAEAQSGVDAETIQPALETVHEAGFLDSATGENLNNLVSILGINRRSATHATGVAEFQHGSVTKTDYAVQNGTIVQTDADDPVEFETTEAVEISLFDDFESGVLENFYAGDRVDFSVVDGSAASDPSPTEGTYELKADAVSGSKVIEDSNTIKRGSKMTFRVYLQNDTATDAVAGTLFGVVDDSNYYRINIDASGTHAIEKVTSGGGTTTLSSTGSLSVPADEWLTVDVTWDGQSNGRIVTQLRDSSDTLINEETVTGEEDIDSGGFGFESLDGSENKYFDHSGERAVQADARAREGGPIGNVGANTLVVLPTVPSGVDSVTNPFPMGDDSYRLTDTREFSTGRPEETDEELRDRAQISEGARGEATVPALLAAISSLSEAESVTVFENKTNNDNTGGGGLPPKAFEVVYFGSDPQQDVADTIFDVKGFTSRDYGGAHGTAVSETVEASNGQLFTINWTEPNEVNIDVTLDIVVNDEFVGANAVRDRIVNYVGGTLSDGQSELGTGTDEDVYIDQIEDIVTGPDDTGVIGISSKSFTPSTTTDANGLEIVDIGSDEVAKTNAQDGSITLNITRV